MSSLRHHSSSAHDASEQLSSSRDVTLPPSLLAALAPRLVSARHVRDSPLAQLHEAFAPGGHRFALHVITPQVVDLAGDARQLATALGELPTLPGLTIPAIEWLTEADGLVCYATAWHTGIPLSAIDPARSPSPTVVAAATRELCGELHALHGRGLAHGMIVPDTLTFASDERRFLLEGTGVMTALGLCGVTPDAAYAACGNSSYAAPEITEATPPGADMRSDIFGLGGTLYELLTGSPPFGGRTTATVMAAVLLDPRTTESASPAAAAVTDVILRCLEQDPADRWPDFAVLADALSAAARGEHRSASSHSQVPHRPSQLARAATLLKAALLRGGRRH